MASNYIRGAFDAMEQHPAEALDFWGQPERPNATRLSQAEKDSRAAEMFHRIVGFATIMRPPAILDLGITDADRLRDLIAYIDRLDSELAML